MMSSQKFYLCEICGNMVGLIKDEGPPMSCCGDDMTELVPNTVEASTEKHLPAVNVIDDCISVSVGSVPHPMEDGHHITFVFMETARGGQRKRLDIGAAPAVTFLVSDDKPVAVFAYCNLHGLWKVDL